jgi:hypothetical protein
MTLKYCSGNARQAETLFGWNRVTVELGLNELRTGIMCLGAQVAYGGNKLWGRNASRNCLGVMGVSRRHEAVAATKFPQ